jgi:hypothetical protein
MIFQGESVFERWWNDINKTIENADPVEVWAWILISLGIALALILIMFTEYKRKERDSVKFSALIILASSACFGLGIHMLLISFGL